MSRYKNINTSSEEILEDHIYIVTEYVIPLDQALDNKLLDSGFEQGVSWGVYQVVVRFYQYLIDRKDLNFYIVITFIMVIYVLKVFFL